MTSPRTLFIRTHRRPSPPTSVSGKSVILLNNEAVFISVDTRDPATDYIPFSLSQEHRTTGAQRVYTSMLI